MEDIWDGKVERRRLDAHFIDNVDTLVRDHEKAINTLISSTQHMTQAIAQFEKQFERIAKTLEKLADIDKHIMEANFIKEDFKKRIETLELSHNGQGCHALKENLIKCDNSKKELQKEIDENYKDLNDRVTKIEAGVWKIITGVFSALGLAILGLVLHK